jgi:ADP-ribose pyrophosphatase YjhB (NUDIX family)
MVQKIPDPKFCMLCGATLEDRTPEADHRVRRVCPVCGFVHYRQPKIAAGVVVEQDGGVVLVRRSVDPRRGFWSFPCGFMEIDETLEETALRETREECGLEVALDGLLGTYSYVQSWHGGSVVVVAFHGRPVGGQLRAGDDADEARVVAVPEIPWNDLAFKSSHSALKDWLARTGPSPRPQ